MSLTGPYELRAGESGPPFKGAATGDVLTFDAATGKAQFLPPENVLLDSEILLSNVAPQTVVSFVAEANTIYILRATVYADDGADPTLKTYIRQVGNNQGGGFVQISTDGALNFSLVATAGGPGTVPIDMQALGPDNNRKTRVIILIANQFAYVDV